MTKISPWNAPYLGPDGSPRTQLRRFSTGRPLRVEKGGRVVGAEQLTTAGTDKRRGQEMVANVGRRNERTAPAAPLGNGRRPQPRQLNSRLRFWPAAIRSASPLTFSSPRSRKRRSPCQSLASAKRGSTHTFRLR